MHLDPIFLSEYGPNASTSKIQQEKDSLESNHTSLMVKLVRESDTWSFNQTNQHIVIMKQTKFKINYLQSLLNLQK